MTAGCWYGFSMRPSSNYRLLLAVLGLVQSPAAAHSQPEAQA